MEKEFLKGKEPEKNEKQKIEMMSEQLNDIFSRDERLKKVRKGPGHGRRKDILIKNLKINFLLNCLRLELNQKIKKFDEEFYSVLNQENEKSPELIKLEKALKFNRALKRQQNVDRITKEISDLTNQKKKPLQQSNFCKSCNKIMTPDQGVYLCLYCNISGGPVEGTSYTQSTSIAGSAPVPGFEKIQMKVNKKTEEKYQEFARDLINKTDNLVRSVSYLADIDDYKPDIWKIVSMHRNKPNKEIKIILSIYLLRDARRRNAKNLKKVLEDIRTHLKIKKNLDHLLDEEEETRNTTLRLTSLLSTDSEKIKKEEILSKLGEIPNELQMAAIIKFVLVKVRGISAKDAENIIYNTTKLRNTKYSKVYKKIKKTT